MRLREDEIRRLLAYLRGQIEDAETLLQIEDELRGENAAEFLREPEVLDYFQSLDSNFAAGKIEWKLRVIPHAHLRIVQRGIGLPEIINLFVRFVEFCQDSNEIIHVGAYQIKGKPYNGTKVLTLRVDVDRI